MGKDICILHANCQGDALRPLLEASPAFARRFEIRQYVNYKRQELADEDLRHCSLFLHQYLAPPWGELSSEQLLSRLPGGARAICLPNFFFKGYWPTWTSHSNVIEFADSLLEELLTRGLPADAVRRLYLKGALLGDVEETARESIARERLKEERGPIKYVDLMEELWRSEQLFITVNHPGKKLLFHLADNLLLLLGMPPLAPEVRAAYVHPQGDFWLPIHPALQKSLHLPFAAEQRQYPCFGAPITHAQYIDYYLACRLQGVHDLTTALAGRAKGINSGK